MSREVRTIPVSELRVETRGDGKKVIRGYSALFGVLSEDLGGFREKIDQGAFREPLTRDDVRGLFNHDMNFVLGRTSSRTLLLSEDERGLFMEAEPPDTQWARDLVTSIERKDVTGQSFSFSMDWDDDAAETWEQDGNEVIRTIRKVSRLYDVGPVTFPAYPQTDVSVASRAQVPDQVRAHVEAIRKEFAAGRSVDLARRRLGLGRG